MKDQLFIQNFTSSNSHLQKVAYYLAKDYNEAEELLSEATVKMYTKYHQFSPNTNFRAWASTIIRNTFINNFRRKKKMVVKPIEDPSIAIRTQSTENAAISSLSEQELYEVLETLETKYKSVLMLLIEGYSYKEIADELERPIGTVKSLIYSARKRMKSEIQLKNKERVVK